MLPFDSMQEFYFSITDIPRVEEDVPPTMKIP